MSGTAALAGRPGLRASHWLAAAALAVLAVIAGDAIRNQRDVVAVAPPLDPAELRPGFGPATYAEALAAAESGLAGMRERLARRPDEWLHMEGVARALAARYRLTGNPADLAEADRLLDRALEVAPWPAGPVLTRAAVSLSLHDLGGAEAALARFDAFAVPGPAEEQAEARSIRCEIAYQRGELAEARRLCAPSDELGIELRRANLTAKSGDPEEAARIVEALLRTPRLSPSSLATLALQRASIALAVGDWEASGRWARAAERLFPGYWLSEAYVAQQYALEGKPREAARRFAALGDNPEAYDMLARLAEAAGRKDEARGWAAKAGTLWSERNRLLPLAYATHHAEHLVLDGDAGAGLALAASDYRRRPSATVAAHYAYALQRNGRPGEALAVVRRALAQGWVTAELKLGEALALGALGRAREAGEALRGARAINPRIDSPHQQFVLFSQA